MATVKSFNNYRIYISSHPQFNEWIANIQLWQDNIEVVDLRFVATPATYAGLSNINPVGASLVFVGIERFPWYVDILRHEKPLWAVLYPASGTLPVRMLLQTMSEPIGEAET